MDPLEPLIRLNHKIDRLSVPCDVNEQQIDALLKQLEETAPTDSPLYWLTMARLTEVTLLCAGHYADNCEFTAAGDLLLNPRKIVVHLPDGKPPVVKTRHGRLSDQLAGLNGGGVSAGDTRCDIVDPALLPYLYGRLEGSDFFSAGYLDDVAARMLRIADTVRFLATYQTFSNEALYRKLKTAGEAERVFVERHLCRFSRETFNRLRRQIEQLTAARALHLPRRRQAGFIPARAVS